MELCRRPDRRLLSPARVAASEVELGEAAVTTVKEGTYRVPAASGSLVCAQVAVSRAQGTAGPYSNAKMPVRRLIGPSRPAHPVRHTQGSTMTVTVDYCGEQFHATEEQPLTIGRDADLDIDDNPHLHRVFLQIHREYDLWWLTNVGSTLTATVADKKGLFQAWLSPGRASLALDAFTVWFTAGPTTYDFDILVDGPAFEARRPGRSRRARPDLGRRRSDGPA